MSKALWMHQVHELCRKHGMPDGVNLQQWLDERLSERAQPAGEARDDLHATIMRIDHKSPQEYGINERLAYKAGHRDARHAAAELASAAPQPADVPEGFVLVPKEPTKAMCKAADGIGALYACDAPDVWAAMLAAAPVAAAPQGREGE